jgi:hypothetical protein
MKRPDFTRSLRSVSISSANQNPAQLANEQQSRQPPIGAATTGFGEIETPTEQSARDRY